MELGQAAMVLATALIIETRLPAAAGKWVPAFPVVAADVSRTSAPMPG
jgi:hypothetical protein